MAKYKNNKIDIVLPWRIGDAVLNIPMLVCLKQLNKKYCDNNKIRIIAQPFLSKLYKPLNIFDCKSITWTNRLISNILPADAAFFTETIRSNWGFTAKKTYGQTSNNKKTVKFKYEMPCLNIKEYKNHMPEPLVSFLRDKYGFGQYSITLFGIILEMGYSAEQIIETLDFNHEYLGLDNFNSFSIPEIQEKYIVFCMEAAYGKKGDANRRWDENFYIDIARKCHKDFSLNAVFVGIDREFKLPDENNFIDLRKKLDLFQLAQVLKSAVYYIGNDTAPLHISNIMQTPSIGAYFMEHSITDFSPIFPHLNTISYRPQTIDDLYEPFKQSLLSNAKL